MSMKIKSKRPSSTSLQSAKKKMQKILTTQNKHVESTKTLGPAEVLSSPSTSPLAEVYKTEDFQREWANDVRFHVAENLVHMRRYRNISQAKLGKATGTSQSAIARIESGQENITLDTLERIIGGLDARFFVSIQPPEYAPPKTRPWWEAVAFPQNPWNVVGALAWQTEHADQVIVGLERQNAIAPANTLALGGARLVAEGTNK